MSNPNDPFNNDDAFDFEGEEPEWDHPEEFSGSNRTKMVKVLLSALAIVIMIGTIIALEVKSREATANEPLTFGKDILIVLAEKDCKLVLRDIHKSQYVYAVECPQ